MNMYGTAKSLYLIDQPSIKEGKGARKNILSPFKDVTKRLGKEGVQEKILPRFYIIKQHSLLFLSQVLNEVSQRRDTSIRQSITSV